MVGRLSPFLLKWSLFSWHSSVFRGCNHLGLLMFISFPCWWVRMSRQVAGNMEKSEPTWPLHPSIYKAFCRALTLVVQLRRSKPKTCTLCQRSSASGAACPKYTGNPGDNTTEPEGLSWLTGLHFQSWNPFPLGSPLQRSKFRSSLQGLWCVRMQAWRAQRFLWGNAGEHLGNTSLDFRHSSPLHQETFDFTQ